MSRLRDRKVSFDLGADMVDIIRDNTTPRTRAAEPDKERKEPEADDASATPQGQRPVREAGAATQSKPSAPPPAPPRSPAAQRGETEAVSIVVPVIDGRLVSEAKALAAETGLPLAKTIAPRIRGAMAALRADLLSGAGLKLDLGYRWPDAVYSFRSSIYLTDGEIERVRQAIDPHCLLSRTKAVSVAVAMYLDGASRG